MISTYGSYYVEQVVFPRHFLFMINSSVNDYRMAGYIAPNCIQHQRSVFFTFSTKTIIVVTEL